MGFPVNPSARDATSASHARLSLGEISSARRQLFVDALGLDRGASHATASIAALLKGLPESRPPRPRASAASTAQAIAALGGLLQQVAPFADASTESHHQYLKLNAMRALVGRALATQSLLQHSSEFKLRIGADRRPVTSSNHQAVSANVLDGELLELARAMGMTEARSFEDLLFLMMTKYAGTKEKEIISKMNELAQRESAAKVNIARDGQPANGGPVNTASDGKPSSETSGPGGSTTRSETDEFGAGLGAGAGHGSNLSNSPEAVLALSKVCEQNPSIPFADAAEKLQSEYGIKCHADGNGITFANGDQLVDSNGNGVLDLGDYNFAGAVEKIKSKYGVDDPASLAQRKSDEVPALDDVKQQALDDVAFKLFDLAKIEHFFSLAFRLADDERNARTDDPESDDQPRRRPALARLLTDDRTKARLRTVA